MARAVLGLLSLALAGGGFIAVQRGAGHGPVQAPQAAAAALAAPPPAATRDDRLLEALRSDLQLQRQLILLFADEGRLEGRARAQALEAGHRLHHDRRELVHQVSAALRTLTARPAAQRDPEVQALLDWMEGDPELLDLDRLAFRDSLRTLQHALEPDPSPAGLALRLRLNRDLGTLDRLEREVDEEYRQVFGGPGQAAPGSSRTRWDAYVAALRSRVSVAGLLPRGEEPAPPPSPTPGAAPTPAQRELTGTEFPEKVLVLTFDDGPHPLYTGELKALLLREHVPAVFFEVGRNLGVLDGSGQARLSHGAALTEDLVQAGFVVGNHSYTHAQLSKETGAPLDLEIRETDQLLRAIPGAHSQLFRFPYGARSAPQLQALVPYHLRSVLWNIDSLDWADPVPSSVADRVLKAIAQEKRGILLFHDIHDRAGKVLPVLIPRLRAEGYTFAGLDPDGALVLPQSLAKP